MNDKEALDAERTELLKEIEELGRLTKEQEDTLYSIALRQDELGRQPTNMLVGKLKESEVFKVLLDREYVTYEEFNNRGNSDHNIASIYVTLKGMRYCILFADELSAQRDVDPAGVRRDNK